MLQQEADARTSRGLVSDELTRSYLGITTDRLSFIIIHIPQYCFIVGERESYFIVEADNRYFSATIREDLFIADDADSSCG